MKLKKTFRFLALTVAAILATALVTFAQDSTAVADPAVGVAGTVFSFLELKWPIISTIGTVLFLLSEALAYIPKVSANGVFQLVAKILTYFKKK